MQSLSIAETTRRVHADTDSNPAMQTVELSVWSLCESDSADWRMLKCGLGWSMLFFAAGLTVSHDPVSDVSRY